MVSKKLMLHKSIVFVIFTCFAYATIADQLRKSLFENTEKIMLQAQDAKAELLAPVSFTKAKSAYKKANTRYRKNQSVEKIKKDLVVAESFFKKAIETSRLADITFNSALKARNDAESVNASKLSQEEWSRAEKQFKSATESLETGSLARARKKAETAETSYRDAELIAIKSNYLSKARRFIAKAKKDRVDRYAPKTLKKAESLLISAEKELSQNRYDTDYPRSLAKQSLYQAKHSIYLAKAIRLLKSDNVTTEELLLRMEEPVIQVAGVLDMVAEFDNGFKQPTEKIKSKIEALLTESQELMQIKAEMAKLEKDFSGLEDRLGIQSQRMAKQEAQRKKLLELNRLFNPSEAIVLTQGDNIIIRAVGLSFDAGSSRVNTNNIRLLQKLQKVFYVFKDYEVVVEGHTDSFGGDSQNLMLSFDRANAIREYFMVNMPEFSEARSQAKGYGETRPIANNETSPGRRKNRRIDLVFIPLS